MIMRLIDADKLIEEINMIGNGIRMEDKLTTLDFNIGLSYAMQMVKAQPTAYDVEKVVAELEEESNFFSGIPMGSLQKAYYCNGVEKAIEIVRKGGIDG